MNLAVELSERGVLAECGVEVLGTKLSAIQQAEDRDLFRTLMNELNEPVPESEIIHSLEEAENFVSQIGFCHCPPGIYIRRNRRRHLLERNRTERNC